ncbi:hypothetical protein [Pseudoxanthomonas mexicana]|uniref:hypothetical protein n=1 Tax=Pseudoxanthomonas mexicana TaxID=128785 RepID=UPI0007832729|nr:hypothetical protein [Pseudoxanthomonas mexicana]
MAKQLKVPSLQHMARIWRPDAEAIKKVLIRLATHGPSFSYAPLFKIVHEMLVFKTPYEVSLEAVQRIAREDVRKNFLGIMPLINDYFSQVRPAYVHEVTPRLYSLSRDIQVPFAPPLMYGVGGEVIFPWLSFWKSNPLNGEALSLFVTIVEELILQDSDLEDAHFKILDFSAEEVPGPRKLRVIPASEIPRVSSEKKAEMLLVFADGFRLARDHLQGVADSDTASGSDSVHPDQMSLL